ncbi:MAG: GxxExxY protein [Muribaculaceae bacterium]|nr:GxxExxY protein [Muribaculaceae bacterium]
MSDKEIIERINQAAFEVRRHLAPGFLESVYQKALMIELANHGLNAEAYPKINVWYKDNIVGEFEGDILVEKRILLELKAVNNILPVHELQLINYLHATGIEKGILINYGGELFAFREKDKNYLPKTK